MKQYCKSCGVKVAETGMMANFKKNFTGEQPVQYKEFSDGLYCFDCAKLKQTGKLK
jgi:hypothetical protein